MATAHAFVARFPVDIAPISIAEVAARLRAPSGALRPPDAFVAETPVALEVGVS